MRKASPRARTQEYETMTFFENATTAFLAIAAQALAIGVIVSF
jgi:hypothetical protein